MRRRTRVLLAPLGLLLVGVAQAQSQEPTTEVIVRGSSLDRRSPRDETANSTVLRRDDLSQPGASTASVVLRVPGAQVQRSGASAEAATLSLRGTTSAQLPVYLGPLLLNDEFSGTADLSFVPLFFIERIEIYRGHAPAFADRLGLSGAVVIEPRLPKRSSAYAGTTLGSYGANSMYAAAAVGNEQSSNLIAIQRTTAANNYPYWNNGGTVTEPLDDRRVLRQNADAETLEFWNTGHYRPTPSVRLRWLLHGLEREQGVTGLSIIPDRSARAKTHRELGALTATASCRSARPNDDCSIELQSQWQRSSFGLDDPSLALGYRSARVDSNSTRASERLRIAHRILPPWAVGWLLGSDIGTLDWIAHGDAGLRAQRRSGLIGLNSNFQATPALTVVTLGRLSLDRTVADGEAGRGQTLASGRVGLRYTILPGLTLQANVGDYGRSPTLAELYGTSINLRGNRGLRAERGTSEDLGISWRWSNGSFYGNSEAIAYHQRTIDLVAWERTTFSQVRPYNVGRARLVGAELSAGIGWTQSLSLEGALGLLDPRDTTPNRTSANDVLPYRSRLSGHLRFDARLPRSIKVPGVYAAGIGATAQHRSSRYTVTAGNAVLPSTTTFDLDGRLTFVTIPVTLRGSILNLFNRQNYDILGMPLPGRCYFVGAEVSLELER